MTSGTCLCAEYAVGDIIGRSPAARELRGSILTMAGMDASILILGEKGSGKSMAAKALHNAGERRASPFVSVQCSGLNEDFFSLHCQRYGPLPCRCSILLAHRGTLFLHGVEELPRPMQKKLIPLLTAYRSGNGSSAPQPDIRFIVSAGPDFEAAASKGELDAEFLAALPGNTLHIPPLRARAGDIPLLANHFLQEENRLRKSKKHLSAEALNLFSHYAWPGNIRELICVIRACYGVSRSRVIETSCFPPELLVSAGDFLLSSLTGLDDFLEDMAMDIVAIALKKTGRNISRTAAMLKISRPRLYRLMNRMPPERLPFR